MTQGVNDLINAIASGDSIAIETAFNVEMSARISDRLEDMRVEVARGMFATESAQPEEIAEAAAKLSLGKLAADHYHHESQTPGGSKAKATLEKVEQHHGKEAAEAVKSHTNSAYQVDNTSGGKVEKHFHSKFVEKHLGGKGSADHEAYKKQSEKHYNDENSHQTDKQWNEHA